MNRNPFLRRFLLALQKQKNKTKKQNKREDANIEHWRARHF